MVQSVAAGRLRLFRLLAVGWMLTILMLALDDSPAIAVLFPGQDKVSHALAFGVLACLWDGSLAFSSRRRRLYLAGLVSLVYGAFIEVAQALFTAGRQAEWGDLLADLAGILVASGMLLATRRQQQGARSDG